MCRFRGACRRHARI